MLCISKMLAFEPLKGLCITVQHKKDKEICILCLI
jgi:hypothetical protein